MGVWLGFMLLGGFPLFGWLLRRWNELWHVDSIQVGSSATDMVELPPGHMGFPFFGETLTFFYYFKILGRQDDFINSKCCKLFVSFEPGPILDNMNKLLIKGLKHGVRAFPINFPGTAYRHALQCRKKLNAIFLVELKKKLINENGVETNDLMDGLMQDMNLQALRASMWAVYYLAKYPNVLHKPWEENMAIRKKKKGDFITSKDISKMNYTNKVAIFSINNVVGRWETIRMANIAPFSFRLATKEVEYKATRPGSYLVFEAGPRICVGNMLERIQLALFLHHLSVGYKWELKNPDAGMVYLPHPTPVDGVEVLFSKLI
ncbi:hypothetical protein I3842_11G037000 [Carya illinoinensis]|uniref:Cytochrome P450 n=1 Tax=Carya illinoinensis TaxID=32201 RepID=A0A922IXP2_CARIL|nr:hypothetical protein I3842_11G037000 [Carya illinoinensis]